MRKGLNRRGVTVNRKAITKVYLLSSRSIKVKLEREIKAYILSKMLQ